MSSVNGRGGHANGHHGRRDVALSVAALGIVYGDIGTSPIYAFRECFFGGSPVLPSPGNVLGVLSLIVWALNIIISVKYLAFVMRADNKGEGGIAALTALLNPWNARPGSQRYILMLMGLFGGALLYGDGSITPAISVLSAVEGLEVAAPGLKPLVIWLTLGILIALFLIQKRGTGSIGSWFGPIICVWFLAIAALGVRGILMQPHVLLALNPLYAVSFLVHNGGTGFFVLGAVFLAVTGGEALYADMGHFGARPIRLAWFALVLPALMLNYFGQGALILSSAGEAQEPFYHLAPQWFLYPLIGLATAATIIASQAVISGAFSLTSQLVRLGQLPRMRVVHTSHAERGQIYIPVVNWVLMLLTLALVLGFRSSDALASAYGIAVAMTMVITSILTFFVALRFGRSPVAAALAMGPLLIVDIAFFSANVIKIADGGWYPVLVAALAFTVMTTWARGRYWLALRWGRAAQPPEALADLAKTRSVARIPGIAVLFTPNGLVGPHFMKHVERHHVLQEQVLLLTVSFEDEPRVHASNRMTLVGVAPGINYVIVRYGFMQEPNIPLALHLLEKFGFAIDFEHLSYYIGRETLIPRAEVEGMWLWREHLFAFLSRNAVRATAYYQLPPEDVVELGFQVEI